jgi:hypothetical protein
MSSPTSEPSKKLKVGNTHRADPQLRPEIDQRLRDNVKISILPHVGTHTLESRYGMEMLVLKVSRRKQCSGRTRWARLFARHVTWRNPETETDPIRRTSRLLWRAGLWSPRSLSSEPSRQCV